MLRKEGQQSNLGIRRVGVNERGHVVGQDHHRAKFSDHEIDLMIELIADGMPQKLVAEKFECSRSAVSYYARGLRRGQTVTGQKTATLRTHRRQAADPLEFDLLFT